MQKLCFDIVFAVWGERYTDLFLKFIIPSYLSKKNVPLLAQKHQVRCKIYTTAKDAETIDQNSFCQKLRSFIPVETRSIIDDSLLHSKNKYGAMGYCHAVALSEAIEEKTILVLASPDALISDGGLERCASLIAEGKKAVNIAALGRAEIESILPHLNAYIDQTSGTLTISNRTFVELGMHHLHKISKMQFWHGDIFSQWPSVVYWRAGEKSLLAKYFHLHPFVIDLRGIEKKMPEMLMCADGGLLEFLGISEKEVATLTDSSEFACLELSSKDMGTFGFLPCSPQKKYRALLQFAFKCALPPHISYFTSLNFRYEGNEELNWAEIEKKQARELGMLKICLRSISRFLQLRNALNTGVRKVGKRLGLKYVRDLFRPK